MTKKNLIYTFVFLCSALTLVTCKDKDCHKDGTCPPEYRWMPLGEAKSYLYALKGSYWIYKNTKTGELDTQVCTGFICDTLVSKGEDYAKYLTIEYEGIIRTIESSFNKLEYYDETAGYNANAPRDLEAGLERVAGVNSSGVFFHPFEVTGGSETIFKGLDSNLVIQGKTYINVARFEVNLDGIDEQDCQHPVISTLYFWAKDVGLVKKTVKDCNYSWELIEYNIVK